MTRKKKSNRGFERVPDNEKERIKKDIKSIGQAIQCLRKEAGFTQESLAETLEISSTSIRQIEIGLRAPSLQLLLRICHKLKVKVNFS